MAVPVQAAETPMTAKMGTAVHGDRCPSARGTRSSRAAAAAPAGKILGAFLPRKAKEPRARNRPTPKLARWVKAKTSGAAGKESRAMSPSTRRAKKTQAQPQRARQRWRSR
jgi:hypothetical protein